MNYSEMMTQGISPILMKTEVDYKVPVTIHDRPRARCWMIKASKMKWILNLKSQLTKSSLYWLSNGWLL